MHRRPCRSGGWRRSSASPACSWDWRRWRGARVRGAPACSLVSGLARALGASASAALRVGVLWTLVPGLCLMVPELDQALALPVAAAVVPVAVALAPDRAGRGLVPLAAGAGALTGV